jgi:ketosteroid isomerase-like protein
MEDNVAVVKRVMDAFERADLDGVLDAFSADCEFDFSNSRGPLSGVYQGRDGARSFLSSFLEPWAALETNTEELVEIADDRVLTVTEVRTRGQGSGVEVDATGAFIWTIRDGVVAAAKMYQSKAEALKAVSAES